jgi:hypothetical protein
MLGLFAHKISNYDSQCRRTVNFHRAGYVAFRGIPAHRIYGEIWDIAQAQTGETP